MHHNLKGSPIMTQTNCYKDMVQPIMEYAATMWYPHQQHLSKFLEMVYRRTACCILQDYSTTSSASVLVTRLGLGTLKIWCSVTKATMMYKIMGGLVDISPTCSTLTPNQR